MDFLLVPAEEFLLMDLKLARMREQNTEASRRYRQTHRAKINGIAKKYYDSHKNDPEWRQRRCQRQQLYRLNKKMQENSEN
jgi:hypothetical protein